VFNGRGKDSMEVAVRARLLSEKERREKGDGSENVQLQPRN